MPSNNAGHQQGIKMIYPVGTKYLTRGKHPVECTVVDVHTTTNLAGEIVRIDYVTEHLFCGQSVKERGVCAVTIARGLLDEVQRNVMNKVQV
jgi:hypothetical protein